MNEVLNQLLMIYQLLMSYQNTDEVLNTGENIDETTTDEVVDEAFNANAKGEEIIFKFSLVLKVYFNKYFSY